MQHIKITIKADHKYRIDVDNHGVITDRFHVDSSWIYSEWMKMSEESKKENRISFTKQSVKDGRGRMFVDTLSIEIWNTASVL